MSANPRIEDLTRLRVWYSRRGPRDGRTGIQPDGKVAAAWRFNLAASVLEAQRVMEMDDPTLNRWREGMGLAPEPAGATAPTPRPPRPSWTDDCPARGGGLSHAHWNKCSPGAWHPGTQTRHLANQCCHCDQTI